MSSATSRGGGPGLSVSVIGRLTASSDATMVTSVVDCTGCVVTVKVVDVAPAAIVTVPGTPAIELLLESVTMTPAAGAALVSVTVP